jgi:MIP family channel proteins
VHGDYLRRGTAEFIGAFTLVFVGVGSFLATGFGTTDVNAIPAVILLLPVAVATGLAIAVMVTAVGHISGAHFNPAVTLSFVVTRRIALPLAGIYWAMQFAGATCAALLLKWVFPNALVDQAKLGVPVLNSQLNSGQGLIVEAILTAMLVFAVFATAVDEGGAFKAVAGFGIGLVITMDILCGGPLTSASMNPARAFGPQLVQNDWQSYSWLYYVGPALGAVIAALVYELLFIRKPLEPVGPPETGVVEPRPGDLAAS